MTTEEKRREEKERRKTERGGKERERKKNNTEPAPSPGSEVRLGNKFSLPGGQPPPEGLECDHYDGSPVSLY